MTTRIIADIEGLHSKQSIAVSDERDLGAFVPSFLDDFGLDPYEFRVYCRLARRAGSGGQCWESINNMAKACRINRKTVMGAIASLLSFGMIRQEKRPGKSDLYKLTPQSQWINSDQINNSAIPLADTTSPCEGLVTTEPVRLADTTSPCEGLVTTEPVRLADTTSPCEGLHLSATGTPPVRQTDTKVFPQGSLRSSSQKLLRENSNLEQKPEALAALPATQGENEENASATPTTDKIRQFVRNLFSIRSPYPGKELLESWIFDQMMDCTPRERESFLQAFRRYYRERPSASLSVLIRKALPALGKKDLQLPDELS